MVSGEPVVGRGRDQRCLPQWIDAVLMKTLILGKDGQVGQAFRSHMPPSEQVVY